MQFYPFHHVFKSNKIKNLKQGWMPVSSNGWYKIKLFFCLIIKLSIDGTNKKIIFLISATWKSWEVDILVSFSKLLYLRRTTTNFGLSMWIYDKIFFVHRYATLHISVWSLYFCFYSQNRNMLLSYVVLVIWSSLRIMRPMIQTTQSKHTAKSEMLTAGC